MTPLQKIKERVKAERGAAYKEAKGAFPWVRSRGTFLATAEDNGDQTSPNAEADCPWWNGTGREIEQLIERVTRDFPKVEAIYIAGGFDGADRLSDFEDTMYEPWVSAWTVPVWTRTGGYEK